MSDLFDNRGKGLEEEYFHRKNKEAIEKMRLKMRIADEAKKAGISSMKCPRCDGRLMTTTFEKVELDICDKCGGVWLDSGELAELTKREKGGWLSNLWDSLDSEG